MRATTEATWADRLSAWTAGVGVGLVALMLTWLAGNRLTGLVWGPPLGPTVAFIGAIVVGVGVALWWAVRLDRSLRR